MTKSAYELDQTTYLLDFPCTDIVKELIADYFYMTSKIPLSSKEWRKRFDSKMREFISFFIKRILHNYKKYQNEIEIKFSKTGLSLYNDRHYFGHPGNYLNFYFGNIDFFLVLEKLRQKCILIDLNEYLRTILNFVEQINVNFRLKEVELMKLVIKNRNDNTNLHSQFLTIKQVAKALNIREDQTSKHWYNCLDYLITKTDVNPSAIGLIPHLIVHKRELTPEEHLFAQYSFYDTGRYYSIILVPKSSSWINLNEKEDENFRNICSFNFKNINHNLDFFSPKMDGRWGVYSDLSVKRKELRVDIELNLNLESEYSPHRKDFEILELMSRIVSRISESSSIIDVSESYLNKRLKILVDKKILTAYSTIARGGLDTYYFLLLLGVKEKDILIQIKNNLGYFPKSVVFLSDRDLFAIVTFPKRWLSDFLHDLDDLFGRGGIWENKIDLVLTKNVFFRGSSFKYMDYSLMVNSQDELNKNDYWKL